MSKALVIKGANFVANKLTTIDIVDPVYCTGISLSQSTLNFTSYNVTSTLVATVTPVDTTESVTWSSSDTSVATVANGLVTAVGIGTATITASCGNYSASCAVTAAVTFNANSKSALDGKCTSNTTDLSIGKDYTSLVDMAKGRAFGDNENTLGGYVAYSGNGAPDDVYPLALPAGASKITITAPSAFTSGRIVLLDADNMTTYGVNPKGARAKTEDFTLSAPFEYTLPENHGANGYVFSLWTSSGGADASTITGDVIVTIS